MVWQPNHSNPTKQTYKVYWTLHLSFAIFNPCSAMAFTSAAFSRNQRNKILINGGKSCEKV